MMSTTSSLISWCMLLLFTRGSFAILKYSSRSCAERLRWGSGTQAHTAPSWSVVRVRRQNMRGGANARPRRHAGISPHEKRPSRQYTLITAADWVNLVQGHLGDLEILNLCHLSHLPLRTPTEAALLPATNKRRVRAKRRISFDQRGRTLPGSVCGETAGGKERANGNVELVGSAGGNTSRSRGGALRVARGRIAEGERKPGGGGRNLPPWNRFRRGHHEEDWYRAAPGPSRPR